MNQDKRWGIHVAGFLVMNANSINVDKLRMTGMKNNVTILVPVSITWTRHELTGKGKCGSARNPITFLHRNLAADLRRLTRIRSAFICVNLRLKVSNEITACLHKSAARWHKPGNTRALSRV